MARFSLSFISIFLVLTVLTLSMPTKRDEQAASKPFTLDGTVSELMHASKLMDGLDNKNSEEKENKKEAMKEEAKQEEAKVYAKLADKTGAAGNPTPAPTPTTKELSSGNFVTPTTTPTHKPTSEPNALGSIPIIGGLLGGAGGGL